MSDQVAEYNYNSKEDFESFVCAKWNDINTYLDGKFKSLPTLFYSSVDIRESKNKYAPVDLNFYPAGFNNLCQLDLDASVKRFESVIDQVSPEAQNLSILVESHTKNLFYLDHLAHLVNTLSTTDYRISLCSFDENLFANEQDKVHLVSHSKFDITIHKARTIDGKVFLGSPKDLEEVHLLICNNDQSEPINIDWNALSTPIHPSPKAGWFRRKKTEHFQFYKEVVLDFARNFNINPELLMADFIAKDNIDFMSKEGMEEVAHGVDQVLKNKPQGTKAFVKADQGTYGMGISVVSSGEEITQMNRKKRNKMDVGKNRKKFTSVIIQEGIDSILTYDEHPAEITIYLVAGCPAGGFIRANEKKGAHENLNSQGMVFRKYCISEIRENAEHQCKEAAYSIVARLSSLAGAMELKSIINE